MLFFFTFILISLSKSDKTPIILVPGLYGSNLYATYNNINDIPWYCPKKMDEEILFINAKFVVPPLYNCLAYLTQGFYDNGSRQFNNIPGVNISVRDFGGDGSVDYIIKSSSKINKMQSNDNLSFFGKIKNFFNIKCYDNFNSLIKYYTDRGYILGENFFAAPYDWRMAPLFIDNYWPKLEKLIENAYEKSNRKKVTLIGFSMGCFVIQQFLSSNTIFVRDSKNNLRIPPIKNISQTITDEWKEKYIEKVVMLAPSFGGSHKSFDGVFNHFTTLIPEIRNKYITNMSTSLPSFHAHFPNYAIFGNITIVQGPDGDNYTARNLITLVSNHSKIRKQDSDLMNVVVSSIHSEPPFDIGEKIPLSVIYNSQVNTLSLLQFKEGWDKNPTRVYKKVGDGTIQVEGPKYICNNWKTENRSLLCIDLNNPDESKYVHSALPQNPNVQELLFNLTSKHSDNKKVDWWKRTGKIQITISGIKGNSEKFSVDL